MRIFIAARIPKEIRLEIKIYIDQIKPRLEGVRWEHDDRYHITLKFLGETDSSKLSDIEKVLRELVKDYSPFRLSISGLEALPNFKNPRVIVIELDKNDDLFKFQSEIEGSLYRIGFAKEERPFKSHITVGRVKLRPRISGILNSPDKITFTVSEIAIINSVLGKEGSRYNDISIFRLI